MVFVARPAPWMIGFVSPPYFPITIGCPGDPDPLGEKVPVHSQPDLKRRESPGWNTKFLRFSKFTL
mgnify:CR=1 FL=1